VFVSASGEQRLSVGISDDVGVSAPDDTNGHESDVFAGLSRTRPQRPSARRAQAKKPATKASGGAKKPPAKAAAPKAAAARKRAPAKPAAPKVTAIGPVPRSGYATPEPPSPQAGGDVIGAAVQAIAEIAQLGAGAGASVLRSLLGRKP
jgi:hypothetical protein